MLLPQKFRIYPNKAQEAYFRKAIGTTRYVFNWGLEEWNRQYEEYKAGNLEKSPAKRRVSKVFTQVWRDQCPWVNEVHSDTWDHAFDKLQTAWNNFFRGLRNGTRVGAPGFKRKTERGSFYVHRRGMRFLGDSVEIQAPRKSGGWLKFKLRQEARFNGQPMSATVSFDGSRWHISVLFDIVYNPVPQTKGGAILGVDAGVAHLATTSEGQVFDIPDVSKLEKHLKKQQRVLARRRSGKIKKGHKAILGEDGKNLPKSNRFIKQSQKVAKLYRKISDIRNNALHNVTNRLTAEHETIFIEKLEIKKMTRRQKGKGRAQKSGLNKAILHSGLAEFRRQMEYKAAWRGGTVEAVPPEYTSQRCPSCGLIAEENRKTQADFCCVGCGFSENADIVGAKNVLHVGMTGEKLGNFSPAVETKPLTTKRVRASRV